MVMLKDRHFYLTDTTLTYRDIYRMVNGAVKDAIKQHPDYFRTGQSEVARISIVKRVAGTINGFAEQSAKGRLEASLAAK